MLSLRCVSVSLLLLSCGARAAPRGVLELPGPGELSGPGEQPLTLQALGAQPADQETYGYLVPRLASKYRPSLGWGVGPGALMPDPRLYVLTELDNYPESEEQVRYKRKMSLSIVSPMSNLRQRLLMEIARKQMRDNEIQAEKNREMLNSVGKRSDHHFQHHFQQPDNQFNVDNGSNTL